MMTLAKLGAGAGVASAGPEGTSKTAKRCEASEFVPGCGARATAKSGEPRYCARMSDKGNHHDNNVQTSRRYRRRCSIVSSSRCRRYENAHEGAASDHGADLHVDGLLSSAATSAGLGPQIASGKTALALSGAGAATRASSAAARSATTGNSTSSFSASKATSTAS